MEFNKKVEIALGQMFKDAKLEKVATPKKVELGSIDDFKSDYTNYVKQSEAIADDFSKYVRIKEELETSIKKSDINLFDEMFLTNSILKIVPVKKLGNKIFRIY